MYVYINTYIHTKLGYSTALSICALPLFLSFCFLLLLFFSAAGFNEWRANWLDLELHWQHAATHCNTLERATTHCNTLQIRCKHTATHCNTQVSTNWTQVGWISSYTHNTLQRTATHCNTLQHAATRCNALQRTATHCNTQVSMNGAQIDWILSICVRVHALGWSEYDPHIQVCVYIHTYTCVFLPEYDAMCINIICAYVGLSMIPTSRCVYTYIHTHTCSCLNVMLCIHILYVHTYVWVWSAHLGVCIHTCIRICIRLTCPEKERMYIHVMGVYMYMARIHTYIYTYVYV